jgi:hypothetical protein
MRDLEKEFHHAMVSIYERARHECGYNATRFLQMVNSRGGLQAARLLLHGPLTDGFAALWELGRLDITMEALILQATWSQLFTDEELEIARRRLQDAGYEFPATLRSTSRKVPVGWWDLILKEINPGDVLYTPGRGLAGLRKKPFAVISKEASSLVIQSGSAKIRLERKCFDTLEEAFSANPFLWLRVASLHDSEPFEDSADKLIRERTGSQLARGNYVCSILEHCGIVRYSMNGNRKGIELSGQPRDQKRETRPAGQRAIRVEQTRGGGSSCERVDDLLRGFDRYLDFFTENIKFSGPSVYFHKKTIERVRASGDYEALINDSKFIELIYATLASWGMHRMGKGGAKMAEFEDFKRSVWFCAGQLSGLHRTCLESISAGEAKDVKRKLAFIFGALRVMASGSKLVGTSKAIHHLLPDLVPPIDRQHTLRFFYGHTNIARDETAIFLECFDRFRYIAKAVRHHRINFKGFNTSVPKIIDNAVMGYSMMKLQ